MINLFKENGFLYMLNVNQIDVGGKRRCLEDICLDAWRLICNLTNRWIQHSCKTKGCAEGYVSIDGLEKVYRPMCAAPRTKLKVSKTEATFVKCCSNSPVHGGKSQKASKFCREHLYLADAGVNDDSGKKNLESEEDEDVDQTYRYPIRAKGMKKSLIGDTPGHDELDCESGGCKSKEKITKYIQTVPRDLSQQ